MIYLQLTQTKLEIMAATNEKIDATDKVKQKSNQKHYSESIELPQEVLHYETKYTETDKKLERFLHEKYQKEINSFSFFPNDIVVRFVLGYKHVGNGDYDKRLKKTDILFQNYLQFHKDADYDQITLRSEMYLNHFAHIQKGVVIFGHDKHGHPILWSRGNEFGKNFDKSYLAKVDPVAIDVRTSLLFKMLHVAKIKNDEYYKLNIGEIGIYKHCVVIDVQQLSWTSFRQVKRLITFNKRLAELGPEMVHKIYMINLSWVSKQIWNLVKPLIDANTREKLNPLGTEYIDELTKDIDITMIPTEFSGNAESIEYTL